MDLRTGQRQRMLRGTLIVGLGTFLSRLLGMLRDVATAAVLGMSAGGVMDSFVLAFRIPDAARRLFGDGSLGVSFLPVFAKMWHRDRQKAWILLSLMLTRVFLFLTILVFLGEVLCYIGVNYFHPDGKVYLTAHLFALLLPYLILICMAAIATATLQTLGRFSTSALVPMILNIVWLFGILVLAPTLSDEPATQCYILAICILVAGAIQFFIHVPFLKSYGFRLSFDFSKVRPESRKIFVGFFPQVFGLMSMQLNILVASGIAWLFTGPPGGTIRWLLHSVEFPLRSGAASAIYYSERLYEFPQGLIGLAIATAIYPLLSRHAAHRDFKSLGEDLSLGLRLQFAFSIPAGVGLMILAEDLVHLLFQRGAFTPADMERAADMVFWFAAGVWAFCSLPIVIRAFYVLEDISTPFRVGLLCCLFNAVLGFVLIWSMKEQGLALAATVSAGIQSFVLLLLFAVRHGYIDHKGIWLGILRACLATGVMVPIVLLVIQQVPGSDSVADLIRISAGGITGLAVYLFFYRFFGGRELGILIRGQVRKKPKRNGKRRK